jgi:hypothetical protein
MKLCSLALASIAALLIPLAACSEKDKQAAEKSVKDAAHGVENAFNSIDWPKLSPEALKTKATEATTAIGAELDQVKDSEGARKLVEKYHSVADGLGQVKDKIKAQDVDLSALKRSVDDAATRLSAETKEALRPLTDKLHTLTQ